MKYLLTLIFISSSYLLCGQNLSRSITIQDVLAFKRVRQVEVSPDNKWIAFTVSTIDTIKDKSNTRIWMISTNGGTPLPMTSKEYSASSPKWSPDGKYLSFRAAKGIKPKTQVWALNRLGGEAQQLTKIKQGVSGYQWSPDGNKLLLVLKDPKPSDLTKDSKDDKKPLPHVIDRIHFKQDYVGYLDNRKNHLYVYNLKDSSISQITSGDYNESQPKWSPDGESIVFTSNRSDNPDLSYNSDIWIVSADNTDKGANLKQVTTNPISDFSPNWSPDGKSIIYMTAVNAKDMPFSMQYVATTKIKNGATKILTKKLNRRAFNPTFSKDGKSAYFGLQDEGKKYLASIDLSGKNFKRIIKDEINLMDYTLKNDMIYTLHSTPNEPGAIYKLTDNRLMQLTSANDKLLSQFTLGSFEKITFKSKDRTKIEGFVIKPKDFDSSKKYPLILWIHGGPISQYTYNLHTTSQLFAANGYMVLLVNPRGSTGYGEEFSKAIFADWGNKDYEDVIAGVDYLIKKGNVDGNKLGVGGWSYGGILTNYVITKTTRFKAAISGASLGLFRANFGHDQYIKWYNAEFGMPWESTKLWEKLSPFNKIEKITTPTLWMGGSADWNVPIINSEQMYLGMKILGRKTQLVVYPGEHHGIRRPSFQKDRWERWIGWFDKFLK